MIKQSDRPQAGGAYKQPVCWRAASMNSQACTLGVQFCSGVGFQLLSHVLHLFRAYFYSDLRCSRLLLDAFAASLFTALLKKSSKNPFPLTFPPITTNTLSLYPCVQYQTVRCGCFTFSLLTFATVRRSGLCIVTVLDLILGVVV